MHYAQIWTPLATWASLWDRLVARHTAIRTEHFVLVSVVHRTCLDSAEVDHPVPDTLDHRHIRQATSGFSLVRDTAPALCSR